MALDDTKTLAERILRLEQKLQRLEKREGRPSVELFDNSAIRNRKIIDDLLVHNHTHANLSGLDADDHTQYLNTTRHDVTDRHTLGTVVPHDSHSSLSNLSNDDHTQYLNTTRHDTTDRHTLGTVVPHDDHGSLSGLADDDHPQYLLTTGKAADSDKLDGVDITAFKGLDSLTDPNADRVLFWDESAGALKWLTVDGIVDTDLGKWQSWTPASQIGWTAMPTGTFRYVNIGKLVILEINVTAGTSNNATTGIALPFTAASSGGWTGTMGFAMNNGAAILTATRWNIAAGDGSIYFFTDMGDAGWAASGTKLVNCVAIYEKA